MAEITNDFEMFVGGHELLSETLSLFLHGYEEQDESKTLYICGVYNENSESIPLYLCNTGFSETITLSIKGSGIWGDNPSPRGVWDDYIPFSKSATLYIERIESLMGTAPLFCKTVEGLTNTYTTLYTKHSENEQEVLPCVVTGHISTNTYAELYVFGAHLLDEDLTLYTKGDTALNSNINLFLCQNNTELNTFTTLYTQGAYLIDDNVTLAIPSVVDYNTDNTTLYIFGW